METLQKAADHIQGVDGVHELVKRATNVCTKWMHHEIDELGFENAPSTIYQEVIIKR